MSKFLLFQGCLTISLFFMLGCGSMITKPLNLATQAVVTPVKAVTGVATDLVSQPLKQAAKVVRPVTPVIRVR